MWEGEVGGGVGDGVGDDHIIILLTYMTRIWPT